MRSLHIAFVLPVALAGCKASTPSVSAAAPALLDAGFESGALAQAPVLGWYSDDLSDGRITAHRDARERVEGRASLAIEIVRPRAADQGLASISQTVDLGAAPRSAGELDLSLALKAAGLSSARIVAYVWDADGRAQPIAEREVAFSGTSWERPHLRLHVPPEHRRVGIFVYVPSTAGGRLWLDDAALRPAGGA